MSTQETAVQKAKKIVTRAEFEKEVEKEIAHLMYFDRLKKDEAVVKAREVISQSYEVK